MNVANSQDGLTSEKYCIFEIGRDCFGISAAAVRAVIVTPEIVPLPLSPQLLSGLCQVQNEFIPVINCGNSSAHLENFGFAPTSGQYALIVQTNYGSAALLIDRALGLDVLEVSLTQFAVDTLRLEPTAQTIGSASYGNRIVQVLDASAVLRSIATRLEQWWQTELLPSALQPSARSPGSLSLQPTAL